MKNKLFAIPSLAVVAALAASTLHAQFINDGATNTLNNVTNTIAGDVTVGTNGAFTLLILANNALLTNSGHGYVGRNIGANSNTVRLAGANTRWLMSGDIFAGRDGAGNQLVVSNGSVVRDLYGYVGYNSTSSSNRVVVTSSGSMWTNEVDAYVGFQGAGNQMVVSNGGVVRSSSGYLGFFSTGNAAVVTDPGSLWTTLDLVVGYNGGGNQLVASNGGVLRDQYGFLGYGSTSHNNTALVTGPGSLWTNDLNLIVGHNGAGNQLVVSNGGVVRNNYGYIGHNATSSSNMVMVTGAGSLWTNEFDLYVGDDGSGNQLVVSNGGTVGSGECYLGLYDGHSNAAVVTGAGSLWTVATNFHLGFNGAGNQLVVSNGGTLRNLGGHLGYGFFSSNNIATVTGAGSLWTNFTFYLGLGSAGNQLVVSNGGVVRALNGVFGLGGDGSNNTAVVTGAGSRWAIEDNLCVGSVGAGNQLVVSNGGVVRANIGSLGGGWFGTSGMGSNNRAVVTGAGSQWTNASDFFVGYSSAGNQLMVSSGGLMQNNWGYVGYNSTSRSNTVMVTGAGSAWTNRFDLYLAWNGAGNQVVVSNGGVLHVGRVSHVSLDSTASNNLVVVTGAGSLWTTAFDLFMGGDGAGNQLMVSDGGVIYGGRAGYVGNGSAANNNMAVVTGAGSRWTNAFELIVGNGGSGNQLVVSNSGVVHNSYASIGRFGGNNAAIVTGVGSRWENQGELDVGLDGAGNRLVVTNGGVVRNTTGTVGNNIGADFNLVRVTGVGSLWTNSGNLLIGSNGAFNQLVVSAGGRVRTTGRVTLGVAATATNNSVLAMGGSLTSVGLTLGNAASRNNSVTLLSGSIWDLGGGLFIWGNAGINDTLTIDATSALTNIGGLKLDENSTAFHLTNAPGGYTLNGFTTNQFQFRSNVLGALVVGDYGTNVQLVISNYTLAGTTGTIGDNTTARSNLVVVSGAGSVWTNSGALNIGNNGSFSQLVVSNGGTVRAGGLVTLGNAAGSTNNSVLAAGGSLSSVGLTLGNVQSRNNRVTLLSGSVWDVGGGTFTWGNAGFNDTLTIDGTSSMTNIGALTLDENNTPFTLTNGPGGSALNGMAVRLKPTGFGAVIVGNDGNNVQLTISNTLADTTGTIGNSATALSNSVFVTGAGSLWTNSSTLTIGNNGAFNQLVISNAATVSASNNVVVGLNSGAVNNFLSLSTGAWLTNGGDGVLGRNTGANANRAFVSGTNSRWLVGNSLYVGSNGALNQLVISNAGTVIAGSGLSVFTGGGVFVGANAGASSNLLSLSSGAQMTNGGNVALGWNPGANSNTVTVSGANTRWQLLPYAYVFVGNSGAGNRLEISNGAQLKQTGNTLAYIGYNPSAINNEVVVTGANSLWTMGDLTVGLHGGGSRMVISDGGRVDTGGNGWIGPPNASAPTPVSNNVALVTGANSRWILSSGLIVGNSGNGSLVISNGGGVDNFAGIIGANIFGSKNGALVTGANSYWSNQVSLYVGQGGSGCSLVITNGGKVDNSFGYIGSQTIADTNEVVVTGAGSFWNNRNELYVGYDGNGNRLTITNGGGVVANNGLYVGFGFFASPTNNRVTVGGGSLTVTNLAGSSTLDIRRGTNFLLSGTMDVDRLRLTNLAGFFVFNGGTLKTKTTTNSNGQIFAVGNGASAATLELAGNGLHTFNNGLAISNNATLRGNGTISGALTVPVGGTLSPGTSIGKIVLSNSPVLLGNVIMEISLNGALLANDQVQVAGPLTYGGSLTVSNVGPTALTTGNSFQLFSASGYAGAFSALNLPTLDAGLSWTNKLLVNGSIEVIGAALPKFASITLSGTNLIFAGTGGTSNAPYAVLTSTNVALPLINWTSIATNQFDSSGNFSFTNGIAFGTPQRFFRIRTP